MSIEYTWQKVELFALFPAVRISHVNATVLLEVCSMYFVLWRSESIGGIHGST